MQQYDNDQIQAMIEAGLNLEQLFLELLPTERKILKTALVQIEKSITRIRTYFPDAELYYEADTGLQVMGGDYRERNAAERQKKCLCRDIYVVQHMDIGG